MRLYKSREAGFSRRVPPQNPCILSALNPYLSPKMCVASPSLMRFAEIRSSLALGCSNGFSQAVDNLSEPPDPLHAEGYNWHVLNRELL